MTAPENIMSCPTDEALAAFLEDRLDPAERQGMIEHLSTCGECRSVIHTAAEFDAESSRSEAGGGKLLHFTRSAPLRAVAALAVAAAAIIVFGPMIRGRWFPPGIESLVAASRSEIYRPSSARLSGEFPYRKLKGSVRGLESGNDAEHLDVLKAAAKIEEIAAAYPTARNLHSLGVAYLIVDQPKDAVTTLEAALQKETNESDPMLAVRKCTDPDLLNDLAAAAVEGNEKDRSLALPAAERAWQLRKDPRIGWTRAIAMESSIESSIESSGNRDRAIQAWHDYLAIETDPLWKAEAQQHLERLSEPEEG